MVRLRSSARRYAEALFQLAERDGTVEQWFRQLQGAAQALEGDDVLRVLENPAIALADREAVVTRALRDASPQVRNLFLLLLHRGRIDLAPRVASEYRRLFNRRAGITEALVASHAPLELDERRTLEGRLQQMMGGAVEVTYAVDEALLGGLMVRLGDRMIDGSVRGRLERLRTRLAASAR